MKRTKLALLIILLYGVVRASGAPLATLPLAEDQGQFWIQGRIGDSGPLIVAFDTGAASSATTCCAATSPRSTTTRAS